MTFGVLALQGAFRLHADKLLNLGVDVVEVRTPEQLDDVEALVLPGGESTTMSMLLESSGLFEPLAERLSTGMAIFGTCAGLILLSTEIQDGRSDQRSFGRLDVSVRRNGYGRQVESFEAELESSIFEEPLPAVFIRAPRIMSVGADVETISVDHRGDPVLVRDGNALGAAFHPELVDDDRLHRFFVELAA